MVWKLNQGKEVWKGESRARLEIVFLFFFWGEGSNYLLLGGFKHFFVFTPKIGEMIQFDDHIFQMGWSNHQLVWDWVEDVWNPKYPEPSKVPILRTRTPAIQVPTTPLEGPRILREVLIGMNCI